MTVRQDGQAAYDRNQRLGLRLSARRFTFSTRTETRSAFADIAEETFSMKALTEGRYRGRDGIWAVFDSAGTRSCASASWSRISAASC